MKAQEEIEKSPEGLTEDGNIDKIRDILFGVQVREFERNFSKLEERFAKEVETLRNETRGKLEKLEQFLNKEFSSLTDKIFEEQHIRSDALKKLTEETQNAAHDLEQKISSMSEKTAKNESDLRMQILDQSKLLSDSIDKKQEEIYSALDRESKELRSDKTDSAALADLFTEMAMRLTGEFKLPDSEYKDDSNDPSQ